MKETVTTTDMAPVHRPRTRCLLLDELEYGSRRLACLCDFTTSLRRSGPRFRPKTCLPLCIGLVHNRIPPLVFCQECRDASCRSHDPGRWIWRACGIIESGDGRLVHCAQAFWILCVPEHVLGYGNRFWPSCGRCYRPDQRLCLGRQPLILYLDTSMLIEDNSDTSTGALFLSLC